MTDNREKAVIDEVRGGNVDHYRFLVERYHKGLVQHLYNITRDGHSAEDLAQDAFIKAYEKLAQYDETYAFSTWLYRIADRLAFRQIKQSKPTSDISDIQELIPDEKPTASEEVDRDRDRTAVRRAIDTLPVDYQQVVTLYYFDNRSYEEIAEIIERPIGTVRTWLFRAKDQLRKELYGQI
jgi:RNA polymerase sigma-70 factor (ECF subfamily)